jgi:hypothetical protein
MAEQRIPGFHNEDAAPLRDIPQYRIRKAETWQRTQRAQMAGPDLCGWQSSRRQPEQLVRGSAGPFVACGLPSPREDGSLNREFIPERVVHARGSAAFGTGTVIHDITHFANAKLFSVVGKRTARLIRDYTDGIDDVRSALVFTLSNGATDATGR